LSASKLAVGAAAAIGAKSPCGPPIAEGFEGQLPRLWRGREQYIGNFTVTWGTLMAVKARRSTSLQAVGFPYRICRPIGELI